MGQGRQNFALLLLRPNDTSSGGCGSILAIVRICGVSLQMPSLPLCSSNHSPQKQLKHKYDTVTVLQLVAIYPAKPDRLTVPPASARDDLRRSAPVAPLEPRDAFVDCLEAPLAVAVSVVVGMCATWACVHRFRREDCGTGCVKARLRQPLNPGPAKKQSNTLSFLCRNP